VAKVEVLQGDKVLTASAAAESLYFQATTRGKREVDSILAGKAQFKEGAGIAATGLGVGALIASQNDRKRDCPRACWPGLALISAGVSCRHDPASRHSHLEQSATFDLFSLPVVAAGGNQPLQSWGHNASGSCHQVQELKPVIHKDDPLQVIFVRF